MPRGRRIALPAALALPFAELGHAIAYWPRLPGSGVHAYFPAALEISGALLAALMLVALAVLTAARVLEGRGRDRPAWSPALLFYSLLAAQLTIFLLQESVESRALPDLATLSAGLLGQEPVAFLGAVLISWLSARLGPALGTLLAPMRPQAAVLDAVLASVGPSPRRSPAPAVAPRHAWRQRGPPETAFV